MGPERREGPLGSGTSGLRPIVVHLSGLARYKSVHMCDTLIAKVARGNAPIFRWSKGVLS